MQEMHHKYKYTEGQHNETRYSACTKDRICIQVLVFWVAVSTLRLKMVAARSSETAVSHHTTT